MGSDTSQMAGPLRRIALVSTLVGAAVATSSCTALTSGSLPIASGRTGLAAQAWVVKQPDVVAFIRRHSGLQVDDFVPVGSDPVAVVRLTWTRQDLPSEAEYNIVVLDPSKQDAAINLQAEGAQGRVTLGWDGRFQVLSERYPFLSATGDTQTSDGVTNATTGMTFRPSFDAPIWIIAQFPRNGAIDVAKAGAAPMVAAFLTGTDEKVWWASPLTSHPLA